MAQLKFGVFLPFYAFKTKDTSPEEQFNLLREIVLETERLGYDSVWLDDHLMYEEWPIFECWTTLSALAAHTSKIRLGTMVTCNQHRNPALLAKTAATLDVLSNGRLEFGIGSGIQEAEHHAYGFDFPDVKVRSEQLGESLDVIGLLWTQKKASYQGKYYTLKEAICEPKPIQTPHPPIIVGGSGEKYTLKVTAKYADRFDWGFLPTIEEYRHKLAVLASHCRTIGRDPDEIERSCWPAGQILIGENQKAVDEKISKLKPTNMSVQEFKQSTLAATPEKCSKHLQPYLDLEVSYFMLYFAGLPSIEGLQLFAHEVMDRL